MNKVEYKIKEVSSKVPIHIKDWILQVILTCFMSSLLYFAEREGLLSRIENIAFVLPFLVLILMVSNYFFLDRRRKEVKVFTDILEQITSKGQITIPYNIRNQADFQTGDNLAFELDGDKVIVTKLKTQTDIYLSGVSSSLDDEWLSDEDEKAWNDL